MIKPKLVLPWVHYQTRRKVLYTYIYLFLFCFFMVGLIGETQVVEPSKTNGKSTEMLAAAEDKVEKQKALEEKAKEQEAEREAQEEAAAKQEAERKAQEEAAAKQEAERKAQEEAAAKQEAERKAQEEAAAKQEAERKAQEQAAAKQEAERKAQEQAAAKQEAERKAQTAKSSGTSGNGEAFVNDPSDDKESNLSCKGQIKGNMNSKIYHMPGGAYYDKTQDDIQWFCSPEEAEKAGFRASKR
ncbi:protein TolA [Metabacillus indicus]|uniref:sunset domain-containing protein n=1 Tax=Metabacillus indicus TaxID=246786 RepID=UPI0039840158